VEVFSLTFSGVPFKGNFDRSAEYFNTLLSSPNVTSILKDNIDLYFANNYTGLPSYISAIQINRGNQLLGTIMLEFQQKAFYEESVYPELVLSENLQRYL
jgi:hypothetical protein